MSRFGDPEPLHAHHLLEGFECGVESLNTWLVAHARHAAGAGSARAFAAVDAEHHNAAPVDEQHRQRLQGRVVRWTGSSPLASRPHLILQRDHLHAQSERHVSFRPSDDLHGVILVTARGVSAVSHSTRRCSP